GEEGREKGTEKIGPFVFMGRSRRMRRVFGRFYFWRSRPVNFRSIASRASRKASDVLPPKLPECDPRTDFFAMRPRDQVLAPSPRFRRETNGPPGRADCNASCPSQ